MSALLFSHFRVMNVKLLNYSLNVREPLEVDTL